ncbi:uncharacterized protein LOC131883772 [Tigriopus californicus]|uniref:uncharacterized protein LOC131883772 n=1 Tax=Tigriopus californicus TaxID=6832 RepID=UPI0027D9FF86|nr:uncharacterized protein LOC131883772 [Tigriopus californicus]
MEVGHFGPIDLLPCILRSTLSGSNAVWINKNSCETGNLNLNYEGVTEEAQESFFVNECDGCVIDEKIIYATYPNVAVKGKLMILGHYVAAIDAQAYCESINSTLVMVKTREEFEALADLKGNEDVHIGLMFKGNMQGSCEHGDCQDLQWIDGSAWKFSPEIYTGLFINENSQHIIMVKQLEQNRFHDTPSSTFIKAACQVSCKCE